MDPYPPFGAARIARYTAFMLQHGTARFTRAERDRQHAVRFMAQMKGLPHKLGQILATRNDTLHQRYTLLLDRGTPLSHTALMHILRQELGPNSDTIEATLTCVAATSLAQVYRGQCETHRTFALKIQYPHIQDILHADMAHIRRLVRLIGPLLPATSRSDPKALRLLIDNLGDALLSELDYAREVRHLTRLGAALAAQPGLTSPQPIRALCTDRVLTTVWLDGQNWVHAMHGANASQRTAALGRLAQGWLSAAYATGLLHADPHPGNLMALGPVHDPLRTTALLDFGQVLAPPSSWWNALRTLIRASRTHRHGPLPEAYVALGFEPRWVAQLEDRLLPLSRSLLKPFVASQPISLTDWDLGAELEPILGNHPIQLPAQMVLVQRTFQGLFAYAQRFGVCLDWAAIMDRAMDAPSPEGVQPG